MNRFRERSARRQNEKQSIAIGIDLGTTYTCAAIYSDDELQCIPSLMNNSTIPSMVLIKKDERLLADEAANNAPMFPQNTIYDSKRMIGKRYKDVQKYLRHWPFKVVKGKNDRPVIEIDLEDEKKQFYPEEISAMILGQVKQNAENFLGCNVSEAVITVPAYFNDAQRKATKDAGIIAGFKVLRIINEPTAAAIAYGYKNIGIYDDDQHIVLVYDLGGGTFDVSLLEVYDGKFKVLATAGNTHLGGQDFDMRLVDYIADIFKEIHGIDLREIPRSLAELKRKCENTKITLSKSNNATIHCPNIYENKQIFRTISLSEFEKLCSDLFDSTLDTVKRVLSDVRMEKTEVTDVVLIGGSSNIQYIKKMLGNYFGNEKIRQNIEARTAVAYGAAIQAAILKGNPPPGIKSMEDVVPISLGLNVDNRMCKFIERNTQIPVERVQDDFTSKEKNESFVYIEIYEGESEDLNENNFLGSFVLALDQPSNSKPKIKVKFFVDENGILHVSAVDETTGNSESIKISNNAGSMSKKERKRLAEAEKEFQIKQKKKEKIATELNDLKSFCYKIRRKNKTNEKLSNKTKMKIEELIKEVLAWKPNVNTVESEEINNKKEKLISDIARLERINEPDEKEEEEEEVVEPNDDNQNVNQNDSNEQNNNANNKQNDRNEQNNNANNSQNNNNEKNANQNNRNEQNNNTNDNKNANEKPTLPNDIPSDPDANVCTIC
ncbi:cytoplasmic heat shock protein 70 [Histomonas meleagridis]|uniref:cytoplasmic heat shock protein 70 n=1 Tax=Histomonas meleagridis TaxID=135588 RepID=UPI00355A5B0D|nr:cytoplasmic heat shock protein 70 [Histomonas meleagridis]KAH0804237.1 cytoplasmic heat shock protein 70 [Histomonas meleagridis]